MSKVLKNRIPSLDGLRAISIILVLVAHSGHWIKTYADVGNLGVRMFFVISSYLITGILYRDVIKNRLDLKTFYFKRLMRTFPAFYFFLLVLVPVLMYTGNFEWSQFWRAPVYLENYHDRALWNENQWFTGHMWSLAVEEQFYLLIAFLFLVFNRNRINKRGLTVVLLAVVFIPPVLRLSYFLFPAIPSFLRGSIHRSFETVADALAVGALISIYLDEIKNSKFFQLSKKFIWIAPIIILAFLYLNTSNAVIAIGHGSRFLYNSVGIFVINILLGLILIYSISEIKSNFFLRVMNWKPLMFIGLLSYSIYLWQQPWFFSGLELPLMLKLCGIFICSLISFYAVEEPFLRWRDAIIDKRKSSKVQAEIKEII
jgi:peptidoglycan/LPS O-acetylase OafA/YrhL